MFIFICYLADDVVAFSATLTKDKELVDGEVVDFDDITRNDGQSYTDICGTFKGTKSSTNKCGTFQGTFAPPEGTRSN